MSGLPRKPQPDPRNARYPVREILDGLSLKDNFRGRWRAGPTLDQDLDPSDQTGCVPFTFCHWMNASPNRSKSILGNDLAHQIYTTILKNDDIPGTLRDGMSLLQAVKALTKLGYVDKYYWAGVTKKFSMADDVIDSVLKIGPVLVGIFWRSGMQPDNQGLVKLTSGGTRAGHCFLVIGAGYHPGLDLNVVACQQPWGAQWGLDGLFYMSFEDFTKLVSEPNVEACVPIKIANHPYEEMDFVLDGMEGSGYLARDTESIVSGLRNVDIGSYDGMWFDMGSSSSMPFTMVGVAVPLDIGWFDLSQLLIGVTAMVPGGGPYLPPKPYRWAFETPSWKLQIGSRFIAGLSVADNALNPRPMQARSHCSVEEMTTAEEAAYQKGRSDALAEIVAKVSKGETAQGLVKYRKGQSWSRGSNWQAGDTVTCPNCGAEVQLPGDENAQGLVKYRQGLVKFRQGLVKYRRGSNWQSGDIVGCPDCGTDMQI